MMTFLIIIHVTACVVLIGLVLIQRGRGAGLVESFAGVESMFGTKTSAFLTRTTTIMSVVFFMTCLALAVMSVRQSKSLMRDVRLTKPKIDVVKTETVKTDAAVPETVKPEAVKAQASVAVPPVETAKPDAAKVQ
jgi:preprotein translocase subunit SecG